jgi:hypothetical protein
MVKSIFKKYGSRRRMNIAMSRFFGHHPVVAILSHHCIMLLPKSERKK